jgi:hypothetical protein
MGTQLPFFLLLSFHRVSAQDNGAPLGTETGSSLSTPSMLDRPPSTSAATSVAAAASTATPTANALSPYIRAGSSLPAYVHRRLTVCTLDAGLCSNWNQDTVDNFDWSLTSQSTPTSYTGPGAGSGGEGAYLFIEANDQTEGAYAAITSSDTGCGMWP